MHKPLPVTPHKKDIFEGFPDWYLKQRIKKGYEEMRAGKGESGEVVFQQLHAKLAKKLTDSQK